MMIMATLRGAALVCVCLLALCGGLQLRAAAQLNAWTDNFNDGDFFGFLVTDVANSANENSYLRNFYLSRDDSNWFVDDANGLKMKWRTNGKGYGLTNRGTWLWWGTRDQLQAQYYWDPTRTSQPLGMAANTIRDDQIVVESQKDALHGGEHARLDHRDRSWTGLAVNDWIKVTFDELTDVDGVAIQGNPDEPEWVTSVRIQTSLDGTTFSTLGFFAGSTSQNDTVFIDISPGAPVLAIRLAPQACSANGTISTTACSLRFEVYGKPKYAPLGLGPEQVLKLSDTRLSNSSFDSDANDARYARLNNALSGWIPSTDTRAEWLRVDLGSLHTITAVAVQGFDTRHVTKYKLEYSADGNSYTFYADTLMDGPTSADEVKLIEISVPFSARYIRFTPKNFSATGIGMRVEVYGEKLDLTSLELGPFGWSDYSVTAKITPFGRNSIGLAFRYLNQYNHYAFKYFAGQRSNLFQAGNNIFSNIKGPVLVTPKSSMVITSATQCTSQTYSSELQCLIDGTTARVDAALSALPYYKIDMRGMYTLDFISVLNGFSDIPGFYVYVLDTSSSDEPWKYCGGNGQTLLSGEFIQLSCGHVSARYIYIASSATTAFSIRDVSAYGPNYDPYRALIKVVDGKYEELWSDDYQFFSETELVVRIEAQDNVIKVHQDGTLVTTVTDDANTPLYRGTIAPIISQEVNGRFDDMSLYFLTTGLTLDVPDVEFVRTGAWRHYSVAVADSRSDALYARLSCTLGGNLRMFISQGSPCDWDSYEFSKLEDARAYTGLLVPNPVQGDYYVCVQAQDRSIVRSEFSLTASVLNATVLLEGDSSTATLSDAQDWHLFKVKVRTSYTNVKVRVTPTTFVNTDPLMVLYQNSVPPTEASFTADVSPTASAYYERTISFPVTGQDYFFAVRIEDDSQTMVGYTFEVIPNTPSILSVDPPATNTAGGVIMTIDGSDFGVANGTVFFGPYQADVVTWSNNEVVVRSAEGEGSSLNLYIETTLLDKSNDITFSFPAPSFSVAVAPITGPTAGNISITVTGDNFGLTPNVTVAGKECRIRSRTHKVIKCRLPRGFGADQVVRVTTAGQPSTNIKLFTYDAPVIDRVSPVTGRTIGGEDLTIHGSNFGFSTNLTRDLVVEVNSEEVFVTSYNDTMIVVTTPEGEGLDKAIRVEVALQSQTKLDMFDFMPPVITKARPLTGPTAGGNTITIIGDNFGINPTVTVGGEECTVSYGVSNHTTVFCLLPEGDGVNQLVRLTAVTQTTSTTPVFFDYNPPTVTSVSPPKITTNGTTHITIKGNNFGKSGQVVMGDVPCSPQVFYNHTRIVCLSPAGEGTDISVNVTGGGQPATGLVYVDYQKPFVRDVSPQRLFTGNRGGLDTITILGSNFGRSGNVFVGPNNDSCPVVANGYSHDQIRCTLPVGQGVNLKVRVQVADQWTKPELYDYAPPDIDLLAPVEFKTGGFEFNGEMLTITGNSFGTVGTVTVNGKLDCPPISGGWGHSQIVCEVPRLGRNGTDGLSMSVRVTTSEQPSNLKYYAYGQPVINTVSPSSYTTDGSSIAQKILTIKGYSFSQNGTVAVDGVNCPVGAAGTSWSHNEVRCELPEGKGANGDVNVTTTFGRLSKSLEKFSYEAPTITTRTPAISGTQGSAGLKPLLVLTGTSFGATHGSGSYVLVGGQNCTFDKARTSWSHTLIKCFLPEGTGTANTIVVYVGMQHSNSLLMGYEQPAISVVFPPNSPSSGNIPITITGTNLGKTGGSVKIAGEDCVILTQNHTKVTCTVPTTLTDGTKQLQYSVGSQFSGVLGFVIDGPQLTRINPTHGRTDGWPIVTIHGESFGSNPRVTFDGEVAMKLPGFNQSYIRVRPPAGSGKDKDVVVATELLTSFSTAVTYSYDRPNITRIEPKAYLTQGTTGTDPITIHGFNLGTNDVPNVIQIGGQPCTTYGAGANHNTSICSLPAGFGNATVQVDVDGRRSRPFFPFIYSDPSITGVTTAVDYPTEGDVVVTIVGKNFYSSGSITVGGKPCPINNFLYDHEYIECLLPAGQGTNIPVVVQYGVAPTQYSNEWPIDYADPVITDINPKSGPTAPGSTVLTITGINFGTVATIMVGSATCIPSNAGVSDRRIECDVPAGDGTGHIVVVSTSLTQATVDVSKVFDYDGPTLTRINPENGRTAGGYNITLHGESFGFAPAVTIGGETCNVLQDVSNHTYIMCVAPEGYGEDQQAIVTVSGQLSNDDVFFNYDAPVIHKITAPECINVLLSGEAIDCPIDATTFVVGGVIITVTGDNFGPDVAGVPVVTMGGLACHGSNGGVHDVSLPHTVYYCALDNNVGLQLPVRVQVGAQVASRNLLSYRAPALHAQGTYLLGAVGPYTGVVDLLDVTGGETVVLEGEYFGTDYTKMRVKYGPKNVLSFNDPVLYNCTVLATEYSDSKLRCDTSKGIGGDMVWYLQLRTGGFKQESAASNDIVNTPRPVLEAGTIRKSGQIGATTFLSTSSEGELIRMNATFLGDPDTESSISVFYGRKNGPFDNECTNVRVVGGPVASGAGGGYQGLECRTAAQFNESSQARYVFQVNANGRLSAQGTDVYRYPVQPKIISVSGCNDMYPATIDCPTVGGTRITISGKDFTEELLSARIGVLSCTTPTFVSETEMTCILPAHVGLEQPLTVITGLEFSVSKNYVSYALADIDSVSGCTDNGNATEDCDRAGTDTIVIRGKNFGASEPLILVGGSECTDVKNMGTDHKAVNCTVPSGTDANKAVLIVQNGGELGVTAGHLSYLPCAIGSFALSGDIVCSVCPKGSYTDASGQQFCKECPNGYYSDAPGGSDCSPCPVGSFSIQLNGNGAWNCTACPAGTFTDSEAQAVCKSCDPGKYVNAPTSGAIDGGRSTCYKCETGKSSSNPAATSCGNCTTGRFTVVEGGTECQICPSGQYQGGKGKSFCRTCTAGKVSAAESASCASCLNGQYQSAPGQGVCLECDAGTFSNDTGLAECFVCKKGQFSVKVSGLTGATECEECDTGEYINAIGQAACLLCPKGTFNEDKGNKDCVKCAKGKASVGLGADECPACTDGWYADEEGAVTCKECGVGEFSNSTSSWNCTACAKGKASSATAATECLPCNPGQAMASTGQALCTECDSGRFTNASGKNQCEECGIGKFSIKLGIEGPTWCRKCPKGQFIGSVGQQSCKECPVGYYGATEGLDVCTLCEVGKEAGSAKSETCTNCTAGSYASSEGTVTCDLCPAGTYTPRAGMSDCVECPAGRYQPESGKSDCIDTNPGEYTVNDRQSALKLCGAGSFSNVSRSTTCRDCAKGKFQENDGKTVCKECGKGEYLPSTGQIVCLECPTGTFSNVTGQTQCTDCRQGKYAKDPKSTTCIECDPGTISAGGTAGCQDCAAGSHQPDSGKGSCILCPEGRVQPDPAGTTCNPCDTGEYQAGSGGLVCKDCVAGTFANVTNSIKCTPCGYGTFDGTGGVSVCEDCVPGEFSNSLGAVSCSPCGVGTFTNLSSLRECRDCPAGKFQGIGGKSYCDECVKGDAINVAGQASCLECPEGTFTNLTGSKTCTPCRPGKYSVKAGPLLGPQECVECPKGEHQASFGQSGCTPCGVGKYGPETGLKECVLCDKGSKAETTGLLNCTLCSLGKFSANKGAITCLSCGAGTRSTTGDALGAQSCTPCEPGLYQDEQTKTSCKNCTAGDFNTVFGQATCLPCDIGTYSDKDQAIVCKSCPKGQYGLSSGDTECGECDDGSYTASSGEVRCTQCDAGKYAPDTNSTACLTCGTGKYSVKRVGGLGATECFDCLAGDYNNVEGQGSCLPCDVGTYSPTDGLSKCTNCPVGYFTDQTGLDICDKCPVGHFTNIEGTVTCEPCSVGTKQDNEGKTECDECPEGEYQDKTGMTDCIPCGLGEYGPSVRQAGCKSCQAGRFGNDTGLEQCLACPKGKAQLKTGRQNCTECPKGEYSDAKGASVCKLCPVGKSANSIGTTECDLCPVGHEAPSVQSTECTPCQPGYFTGQNGTESCFACEKGKYFNDTGATQCSSCAKGRFQGDIGKANCTLCAEGKYAPLRGATACLDCDPGSATNFTGQLTCPSCKKGQFESQPGESRCDPCPAGYVSNNPGKTVCDECVEGTYQPQAGEKVCIDCVAGKSQSQVHSTKCDFCDEGRFQPAEGQRECNPCDAGTFANSTGFSTCYSCRPGLHQPENGQTSCKECIAGRTSTSSGSKVCKDCGKGRYTPFNGTLECIPCSPGTEQPETGSTTCDLCSEGFYTNVDATESCAPCEVGKFQSGDGGRSCEPCGVGKYAPTIGMSVCSDCPVGEYASSEGLSECQPCDYGEFANITGLQGCFSCKIGTYADFTGSSVCKLCSAGSYSVSEKTKTCVLCGSGTFNDKDGSQRCDECSSGTYQEQTGQSKCDDCVLGRFAASTGRDVCKFCEPGRYTDVEGSQNCTACETGRFQNAAGAQRCNTCQKGKFQDSTGQSDCKPCTTGKYGNATTSDRCFNCPPGHYSSVEGQISCEKCVPGRFSQGSVADCTDCPEGQISALPATELCTSCSDVAVSNAAQTECLCKPGYYLEAYNLENPNLFDCVTCPRGANCKNPGSTFRNLKASKGWWRATNETIDFFRCQQRSHCAGGEALSNEFTSVSGSGCAGNRVGIMCSYCESGYRTGYDGTCEACPESDGMTVIFMILIAVGFVLLVWIQMIIILKTNEELLKNLQTEKQAHFMNTGGIMDEDSDYFSEASSDNSSFNSDMGSDASFQSAAFSDDNASRASGGAAAKVQSGSGSDSEDPFDLLNSGADDDFADLDIAPPPHREPDYLDGGAKSVLERYGPPPRPPNFTYKLKIFVGFLQIVTSINNDLEILWPETFKQFILLFDIVNIDFLLVQMTSSECIGAATYYNKYLAIVLAPIVIFLLVFLFYLLPKNFDCCCYKYTSASARIRSKIRFWRVFLYALFIIYPGVSSTVLELYVCKDVESGSYLKADYRVVCFDDEWTRYAFGSMILLILYPIGIPVGFYVLLRMHRHQLRLDKVKMQLGFLYAGYRDEVWYFELIDTFHKLFITSILVFFDESVQLSIGMLVVMTYTIIILRMNPYLQKADDKLHLLANVEIFLLLLAGAVFYEMDTVTFSKTDDVVMSVALIFIALLFFSVFLMLAWQVLGKQVRMWYSDYKTNKIAKAKQKEIAAEHEENDVDSDSDNRSDILPDSDSDQESAAKTPPSSEDEASLVGADQSASSQSDAESDYKNGGGNAASRDAAKSVPQVSDEEQEELPGIGVEKKMLASSDDDSSEIVFKKHSISKSVDKPVETAVVSSSDEEIIMPKKKRHKAVILDSSDDSDSDSDSFALGKNKLPSL